MKNLTSSLEIPCSILDISSSHCERSAAILLAVIPAQAGIHFVVIPSAVPVLAFAGKHGGAVEDPPMVESIISPTTAVNRVPAQLIVATGSRYHQQHYPNG